MTEVTGRRDPDALLARAGIDPDPSRDQHFLVDDRVLDRLPGYLPDGVDRSQVLEIGGGTGALTDRLLAATTDGHVTVIERDASLAAFLRTEFAAERDAGRLTVTEGDAVTTDLGAPTACVANLPYGASSEITFRLLPCRIPTVLTFQREFAERMAAAPGTDAYGRLSVTAGHFAAVEIVEHVPPEAFRPPPAVESAVVRTRPRTPDYEAPEALFMDLVRAVFTQRRKTMRNAIRNTAHISGLDAPDALVAAADEDLMHRRPGTVEPAAFAHLARLAVEVNAIE